MQPVGCLALEVGHKMAVSTVDHAGALRTVGIALNHAFHDCGHGQQYYAASQIAVKCRRQSASWKIVSPALAGSI